VTVAAKHSPLELLRDFTRLQVRAGLLDDEAMQAEITAAIRAELPRQPDPETTARQWIDGWRDELTTEQQTWPSPTDHERLVACFEQLVENGVVVLQAVDDHWSATAELERLDRTGTRPLGIVWFTQPDVWHAIDHGMLELNIWHGDTANVAPGDFLLDLVLERLAAQGLDAHFDEGRVEVAAFWQRRATAGVS
jgi:Domain of unknown function (DUF6891)